MFKRDISMGKQSLVPFIILGGLIVVLCIWKCYNGSYESSDGYEDAVPEYCGTYGTKFTDAYRKMHKEAKDIRRYSPSECAKLEGGKLVGSKGECAKPDGKGGNEIDYSEKCAGLNKLASSPPPECTIDKILLGKNNKAFSLTRNSKTTIIDDNVFRIYTKPECDKLKGGLRLFTDILEDDSEKKKYIETNGKDTGICIGSPSYSELCVPFETPSAGSKVADIAKESIKGWLGI
jgi:hypothetical protein